MKSTTLRSGHACRSASPVLASLEMVAGSRLCRGPSEHRIADILRRAKGDGLTKHDLTRRVPFVDHRRRNAVLAAMIEAEEIVARRQVSATKSAIVLRLAEQSASRPPISAPEPEPAGGRPTPPVILALDLGQRTGWTLAVPHGGITKKHLYDRTRFLTRRDREDILAALIDGEEITITVHQIGCKPTLTYRAMSL